MKSGFSHSLLYVGVIFLAKGSSGGGTVQIVTGIVEPVIRDMGLTLWDVRFEKEGAYWYLRIFIDKEGGVDIDDCERVSRGIDKLLDDADPISQSYYLEVSSPGVERDLVKDWHFKQFLGHKINVRLIRPVDGQRDFTGELMSYEDGTVTMRLENETVFSVKKADTAFIRLYDDFDMGGSGE